MAYNPFDFDKLYQEAKGAAEKTGSTDWLKYGYNDPKVWEEDFRRGQQDLYWLCTDLLELALVDETHRPITDDFFVKKNPYIEARNWKDAVAKQSTFKNRLLLYPRGTFKSSIDMADAIQWIICFPNIRVFYMTAEEGLAADFVRQTKSHFQVEEDKQLSRFQMLYFTHCVSAKKKESEFEFMSRSRKEQQAQPTLLALSLGMSTAGKHADVGKFDDCVSNTNSGPKANEESRKKVTAEIKLARPIVDLYGYRDYVGTPYDISDAYSSLEETIVDLKVLKEPAWVLKPGSRKKTLDQITEDDIESLLFEKDGHGVERLSFKALKTELNVDAYIFSCQYLINPTLTKVVKFTEQMIRAAIIPHEQFPQPGTYFVGMAWDFAKTDNPDSDRSVGGVALFTTKGPMAGRMYIADIRRGRYSKSDLPHQFAGLGVTWRPLEKIGVEKSPGADFLENDILRALAKVGYHDCPPIEWFPVDNQRGAKNARAEGTENLFLNQQIFFSDQIPKDVMNDVIREFVQFKAGTNRKDDSVDMVGHLSRFLPKDIAIPQTEQEKITAAWDVLAQKQRSERQFGHRENPLTETGQHWKTDGYDLPKEVVVPPPTHWEGMPIIKNYDEQLLGS